MLFIEYPKCSTCRKAKKWLDENNIDYIDRHIIDETPTFDELKEWYNTSGLPLKRFFNTSGKIYRELNLKDKFDDLSEDDKLKLLSSNGMLIKRPIIVEQNLVLLGFKQKEWEENLL